MSSSVETKKGGWRHRTKARQSLGLGIRSGWDLERLVSHRHTHIHTNMDSHTHTHAQIHTCMCTQVQAPPHTHTSPQEEGDRPDTTMFILRAKSWETTLFLQGKGQSSKQGPEQGPRPAQLAKASQSRRQRSTCGQAEPSPLSPTSTQQA